MESKNEYRDKNDYEKKINDVQNLIYALKFEEGPKPRGRIDNMALLFFALIEHACLKQLPWQTIKVAEGPKSVAMFHVLKAAKSSLEQNNPEILDESIERYKGQYDLVKPLLGEEKSLSDGGYVNFAAAVGTIKDQPGYLVYKKVTEVKDLLQEHNVENKNRF